MNSHVNSQIAFLGERGFTCCANIWPFTGVPTHMNCQAVLVGKCLTAYTTLEWFLTCVGSLVDKQMVFLSEGLRARAAGMDTIFAHRSFSVLPFNVTLSFDLRLCWRLIGRTGREGLALNLYITRGWITDC